MTVTTPAPRTFGLGAILTVTTDVFLVTDIGDIYELLNYMTGDNLFTHQLPRAAGECKPALLEQHPQLADIAIPELPDADAYMEYLARLEGTYGTEFAVTPLPADAHTHMDPLSELADMMPGKPVIAVITP
ncbi:DUF7736 domain-containing protein [Mycobacteroides abscessus]|uniref:DUF7736 domain-containing protein n=1 Tax=Mycobacteroides abscessus TaxID=36809 RepID=UPI0009A7B657|nr:hypothetical protein [Mycobacteroides abscessus]SKF79927.1 Uncharacterised protein [Mycobacteroides abscessus subsp. bolletii]SKG58635.1 Uncharacterised protein [Mycobacteroides abscessus subsp. bolletii]SKG81262.1 Uncharacterised protein [Mycobacteroides abscessus subsp. bolletii]SKG96078.1 Uncharacterised protein [Mycobacteroides abscessus subsp. bolletii]SKH24229.1 Uncharacterised protein [Mycobacteroides abscessus subsp. bolletii]